MNPRYTLVVWDFVKGAIMAVGTSAVTLLSTLVQDHGIDITSGEWKQIASVGLSAFLIYLLKNYLTDGQTGKLGVGSVEMKVE